MKSLPDEISQRFVIGLSGPTLSDADRAVLSELRPAGVMFRAHNFNQTAPYAAWLETLARLEQEVRGLIGRSSVIIAIDHEGGRVHRTPPPLTHFPAARQYASHAEEVGYAMGIELQSIGCNFSFAPVADIDSNPTNTVIGARAFGTSPHEVAEAACKMARGLARAGIIAAGKHFPGHGDTSKDSHEELPTLELDIDALLKRELVPFKALIEREAIPVLLTSHILFPLFDTEYPATLSAKVLAPLAREQLGFRGVIMTDDLDMKAISEHYSDDEVALRSFEAGCDMLLFNHDPARALRIAHLTESLLDDLSLSPDEFAQGTLRVRRLLDSIGGYTPFPLDEQVLANHQQLCERVSKQSNAS